jgi:hypothetical protein
MSYTMLCKIGKSDKHLTQTDMMLVDFEGNISPAQGAICVELTIGSKTLSAAFFVIKGRCVGHTPRVLMQGRKKSRRRTPTIISMYSY